MQVSSRCFPYTALRLLAKSQSADGFRLTEERATPNTFMAAGAFLKGTTKGESHVTWGLCVCGGEMEGGGAQTSVVLPLKHQEERQACS